MKKCIVIAVVFLTVAVLCLGISNFFVPKEETSEPETKETETGKTAEEEIQTEVIPTQTEEEKENYSKTPLMKGIDVSKWQGKPDWKKIAAEGVEFAMIRIGYHGTSGPLGEDSSAEYNLKSADENGILTGVYFYSLAKNIQEAEEEAGWVLERAEKYAISLPIVIDYEMMDNDRTASAAERTEIALAFLQKVRDAGYDAMIYVPIQELNDEVLWEKDRILDEFKVWGADYELAEGTEHPDGVTDYAMWQYSNTGRISGISGNVDLNFAYFTSSRIEPKNP